MIYQRASGNAAPSFFSRNPGILWVAPWESRLSGSSATTGIPGVVSTNKQTNKQGPARPFERCPGCPVNSPDQCHTPACKTRTLASRSEAEQGNVFSGGHPGGHSTGPERPRDHPPCCSGYSSDRLACSPCPNSASYLRLGAGYGGLVDAGEGAKGMVPHVHTHDEHGLNVRYR